MFSVESDRPSRQRDRRADFQLTVSCAAMLAVAAFGLVLPEPPVSAPLTAAAMATRAETANAASVPAVGQTAEPAAEVEPAPAKLAANPACAQQSWPYVCTEGSASTDTQRRLRVISADRNAPTSIVVSASTRSAPAATTLPVTVERSRVAAAAAEEGPTQPVSPVALHEQAAVAVPVSVAAPIVAAAAEAASAAGAAPVATPAATNTLPVAKRKRSARNRAPRATAVRMATSGRQTFAYNDERGLPGRALGYDAYPRHRLDSFPWISGR